MANGAVQDLKSIIRGVGDVAGLDLANECKSGTLLPVANIANGILASQIASGLAKRVFATILLSPAGGAVAVNDTVYFGLWYPRRAGILKAASYATHVDTVSGTNTLKLLKAAANGTTMLSAASVSLNATVIDTATAFTLSATAADLALTAAQGIYCEFAAGTQGAAAKDVKVILEFEPTDY